VLDNLKKSFSVILSKPLNILKTSIKSPRNFLVSRVVKPNFCNRSVYDKLLSLVISLVAVCCTLSSMTTIEMFSIEVMIKYDDGFQWVGLNL